MNIKKVGVALAVGIALGGVSAAGSASASRCGSQPDGVVVPGDFSTYNSAGEIVSYNATHGVQPDQPGQVVKVVCGGAPG
jgi:hypothetical protein